MTIKRGLLLAAALLTALWPQVEQAVAGGVSAVYPTNHCSNTARNALRACESEAINRYWVTIGQCENLRSVEERIACRDAAGKELASDLVLCQERYEVRLEVCGLLGEEPYDPEIDPADFVSGIDHPYLPFPVGTTLVYEGETEDGLEHIESSVSGETIMILGVECLVVTDTEWIDGQLVEITNDYFAQDIQGNIWYFGESAWKFENDVVVGVDGTWQSGENGAKPGIIMYAYPPPVNQIYRQEFSLTEAEDLGKVLSLNQSVTTPFGTFTDCLHTLDSSPLEPDANEQKFYATAHGLVLILNPDTGDRLELVDIINH